VLAICQEVEGSPLGLELAATRLRQFSSSQLAQRLKSTISILSTTQHDIPERHRSLYSLFEKRCDLLPPTELETAKALALVEGRFSAEELSLGVEDPAELLVSLVNKSFLYKDAQGFFQMPELCRKYLREKYWSDAGEFLSARQEESEYIDQIYDGTTGLLLPPIFWDRLKHLGLKSRRNNVQFAVMVTDLFCGSYDSVLDEFARETVLKVAADRLYAALRASDTIARLKDEEIGLLIEPVHEQTETAIVAGKIITALEAPFEVGQQQVCLQVRVGISVYPQDGLEPQVLVDKARQACQLITQRSSGYSFSPRVQPVAEKKN
jgi:diguanylate cyclase (GGDEF)-like protein